MSRPIRSAAVVAVIGGLAAAPTAWGQTTGPVGTYSQPPAKVTTSPVIPPATSATTPQPKAPTPPRSKPDSVEASPPPVVADTTGGGGSTTPPALPGANASPPSSLAYTGSRPMPWLVLGAALLLVAGGLWRGPLQRRD